MAWLGFFFVYMETQDHTIYCVCIHLFYLPSMPEKRKTIWSGLGLNPGPLASQATALTTWPCLLGTRSKHWSERFQGPPDEPEDPVEEVERHEAELRAQVSGGGRQQPVLPPGGLQTREELQRCRKGPNFLWFIDNFKKADLDLQTIISSFM